MPTFVKKKFRFIESFIKDSQYLFHYSVHVYSQATLQVVMSGPDVHDDSKP